MADAFADELQKLAFGFGSQDLNSLENNVGVGALATGVGSAAGARLGGVKNAKGLATIGLGGALAGAAGIGLRRHMLKREQGISKSAGMYSRAGKAISNAVTPGASNVNRLPTQAVQSAAAEAPSAMSQVTKSPALRKATPYIAAAGAGALGFQQLRKGFKDWETGRAMRLQQEAYSPT